MKTIFKCIAAYAVTKLIIEHAKKKLDEYIDERADKVFCEAMGQHLKDVAILNRTCNCDDPCDDCGDGYLDLYADETFITRIMKDKEAK